MVTALDRYELRATQDDGSIRVSYHPTLDDALVEAERYRADPGSAQVFGVVIRDRYQPTGDAEVANQVVVLILED